jgi:signal transduction histidine kinase
MRKRPAQPRPARGLTTRLASAEKRARHKDAEHRRVVQELDVYREEVRQQTEELLTAQHALEASRDRYARLYDFAPIAYLTLDRNGVIDDLNLTAARLLSAERARVIRMPFLLFVQVADRGTFLEHMARCRRHGGHVSSELTLAPRWGGGHFPALLSTFAGNPPGPEMRTAVLDLSERRKAQEQESIYQERLRSLASELSLTEERERRRIAVEIHDQISQSLAMAKMKLDVAGSKTVVTELKQALREVAKIVEDVLGHTRSLTFELSPPVLHELGFEPALEWLAERAQKQYHLRVEVDTPRERLHLPHELAVLLFQATRELLMNVVKHADASRADVRLRRSGGGVRLVVEDDGRGFRPGRLGPTDGQDTGFGLFSIRARLQHLGGTLSVELPPAGGSRVTLSVPVVEAPVGDTADAPPANRHGGGGRKE